MEEKTCKSIEKILTFENSGETLSVKISIENVSSSTKMEAIIPFLEILFQKASCDFKFYNS